MSSESIFTPFAPQPPAAPQEQRPKRGPRKKKAETATLERGESAKPKKPRKQRQPRTVKVDQPSPRIDLLTAFRIALTMQEGDAELLMACVTPLQDASKAARNRVLTALQQVFA